MRYKAGALVRTRERDWIVLPSPDENLLLLKPLGGSDAEKTGIYLPLGFNEDISPTKFPQPTIKDLGDFYSAKLLYNAARLSFRNAAGPFRCMGKLSFRPRAYQVVPLIMALRQQSPLRLFIADDVGIGKTIEALLIVKELLERKEVPGFAVIALSHLCEQWQVELKEKFGIDAVIIQSATQARLDREIHGDTSIFKYYPFQVISVDYIKAENRRNVFIKECPKLVIVDEVHSCARPAGASNTQQQRYHLIRDLANKKEQHLILLTATPHSGKSSEFQSLIGLLDRRFEEWDIFKSTKEQRVTLARHFIQRRRMDVIQWMEETTPFPERDSKEIPYITSPEYLRVYNCVIRFASALTNNPDGSAGQQRFRYWSALALLRGIMSSPASGISMLNNRIEKTELTETDCVDNPVLVDEEYQNRDYLPFHIISGTPLKTKDTLELQKISSDLAELAGIEKDAKVAMAYTIAKNWIKEGIYPIIFCRFIATAKYVGEILKSYCHKSIDIQVITSEDPDDLRKERIEQMGKSGKRILVATDCLSEGINLQDHFTAVLHYDLPWNPNRLEQREGRVDRFGQKAQVIKTYLLFGQNNPVDGVVLKVLIRKIREIRKSTGISIPFPENSQTLMDAVFHAVLKEAKKIEADESFQPYLEGFDFFQDYEAKAGNAIEKAAEREKASRSIFAQHSIKAEEIEEDLHITDESVGKPRDVEDFVVGSLTNIMGVQVDKVEKGYRLHTIKLPESLKIHLLDDKPFLITFYSPVPEGYYYLGRNHPFVENLCQILLSWSLQPDRELKPYRAGVIRTKAVTIKTTVFVFRVRNVVQARGEQMIAEETLLWGYHGLPEDEEHLTPGEVKELMKNAGVSTHMELEQKAGYLKAEIKDLPELAKKLLNLAEERALELIKQHERFRKLTKEGNRLSPVKPVLPMDILGLYILLPELPA